MGMLKTTGIIMGATLAIVVAVGVLAPEDQAPADARTNEQRQQEEQQFQRVVTALQGMKSAMKEPASFDVDSALMMDDGSLCVAYRAKNSFGAIVPGNMVFHNGNASEDPAAWNRHCGGKMGKDMTHARRAI